MCIRDSFDTFNAFYKLIDSVEAHVRGVKINDSTRFVNAINDSIRFLSEHYISKNEPLSLVFNGRGSFFLVDVSLLWSLFCSAYVFEKVAPSYSDFLDSLYENFTLRLDGEKTYIYHIETVSEPLDHMDDPQVMEVTLNNVIALPYKEFPMYTPDKKIVIKKSIMVRDVSIKRDEQNEAADFDSPPELDIPLASSIPPLASAGPIPFGEVEGSSSDSKKARRKKQSELFNKN